jgi:hypothetical protein
MVMIKQHVFDHKTQRFVPESENPAEGMDELSKPVLVHTIQLTEGQLEYVKQCVRTCNAIYEFTNCWQTYEMREWAGRWTAPR